MADVSNILRPPYLCPFVCGTPTKRGVSETPENENVRNLTLGEVVLICQSSIIYLRFLTFIYFFEWLWFWVLIAWIMTVSSLYKRWDTESTLNRKSSSSRESLGNCTSLYSCNTSSGVYKNASYRGHCAALCIWQCLSNDLYKNIILQYSNNHARNCMIKVTEC